MWAPTILSTKVRFRARLQNCYLIVDTRFKSDQLLHTKLGKRKWLLHPYGKSIFGLKLAFEPQLQLVVWEIIRKQETVVLERNPKYWSPNTVGKALWNSILQIQILSKTLLKLSIREELLNFHSVWQNASYFECVVRCFRTAKFDEPFPMLDATFPMNNWKEEGLKFKRTHTHDISYKEEATSVVLFPIGLELWWIVWLNDRWIKTIICLVFWNRKLLHWQL